MDLCKGIIIIIPPDDVKYILDILKENGFEGFIVGGCVRDSILGKTPKDWDITTNALPLDVINIFTKLGLNVIETGLQHGTVTVMINHIGYEITTYRIDGEYNDNRHPNEVKFVDSLEKDLSRRDFTINSMAYNSERKLVDPFDGLHALNSRVIQCVGNPYDRFSEDALRMMRAIRFSSQLDFNIYKSIREAIFDLNPNLEHVSKERIRDEFNKILLSNNSDNISLLIELNLSNTFIPEINDIVDFNQLNPYHHLTLLKHTLKSVKLIENQLHLRLTMLLHDIGKVKTQTIDEEGIAHYYGHPKESVLIATSILKRMKYDNDTSNKVLILIQYHDCTLNSKSSIKRMLNKMGESLLRDLIKVQRADIFSQNPIYMKDRLIGLTKVEQLLDEIIMEKECFSIKDLKINGKDLIELGYKQGIQIGETLNKLLKMVIEDNSINTKDKLMDIVKKDFK